MINVEVDFEQIILNIRRGTYNRIGTGSGRTVFDLGNGFVIKVARNRRGIAQNKAEYHISSAIDSCLFAKIQHVSEDYRFLIMVKAEKIKNISYVWNYFNVKNNRQLYQLAELKDIAAKHHLILGDFGIPINWGKIDDKPVIIDYGFTHQVKQRFY